MISIKSEQEIEYMKVAGKIAYDLLMSLKDIIKPGITTKEIDKYAYDFITSHDATPAFLDYEGYPASTCISINDMVVHGIPDDTKIKEGDIVSVDTGAIYKGYYSDTAYTYIVGRVDMKTEKLVRDTRKALYDGISKVKAGAKLNDVCKAIGEVAKRNGYGVFEVLTGHGVGKTLHEDPYIPNYNKSGRALKNLTEICIITGQYALAKKYLSILDETTFYRRWVCKMRPLVDNPKLIEQYPFMKKSREQYLKTKDYFFI